MRFSTHAALSLSLLLMAGGPADASNPSPDPGVVARCPEYGAHLQKAQEAIARGERASAVAILRDAMSILRRCEEDTAARGVLLGHAAPPAAAARAT